ncbi:MAG: hypothetical protein MJK11_15275 [Pseudomonadales bacterium]|nr:hypothetical protein [Pseudomonadales bacterium]
MKNRALTKKRVLFEAIMSAFVFATLLGGSTYLVYSKSLTALEDEIKIGLLSSVKAAAKRINFDGHQNFDNTTTKDDPTYIRIANEIEKARQELSDVTYAYTVISAKPNDTKYSKVCSCVVNINLNESDSFSNTEDYVKPKDNVLFVVNISPQYANKEGIIPEPPALMDIYDDSPPGLLESFGKNDFYVTENPYTDEWGSFITAYAQINIGDNSFGFLGMDLKLSKFYERLKKINVVFKRAAIIIIFLSLIVGLAIWSMRRAVINIAIKYVDFKQDTGNKQQHSRLNSQLFYVLQSGLLERIQQGKINNQEYDTQLSMLDEYGQSFMTTSDTDNSNFLLSELMLAMTHKLKNPASKTIETDMPQEIKANFKGLNNQFSQLLMALDQLTIPTSCQFNIIDESPLNWSLSLVIKCEPSEHSLAISQTLNGLPNSFKYPNSLQPNNNDQAWLWLHQVRNISPLLNSKIKTNINTTDSLWELSIEIQFDAVKV